jgi:outer membrane receptor for ferrienterochelin and colicins
MRGERGTASHLILISVLLGVGAATAAAQQTVITGRVRDAQTDSAIAGATVLVPGTLLGAVSDNAGTFRIIGAAAGPVTLRILAVGYHPDSVQFTLAPDGTPAITVRLAPSPLSLAPVEVTASRRPEEVAHSAVSVAVLPAASIMNRDVSGLEGAFPFVQGVTFNGPGQMDIRGSTGTAAGVGSRVLILLDGHPMLSADGGEIIWEALPLLDVDRVEVVKGAYSSVYGSNALGGVANIITTPIDSEPETVVRAHYDVYEVPSAYQFASRALTADGVQLQRSGTIDGVGVRVAAARELSDGDTQNGNFDRLFLRAKVESPRGSAHPWDGYAIVSRDDAGNFLTWRSNDHPFEVDSEYLGDRAVYKTLYAGGTLTPLVGPTAVLKVSPSVSYNANQDYFHTDQDYHRAWRSGATVQLSAQPDEANTVVTGVDGAYTTVTSNFLGAPDITDVGVFAQDQWSATQRLEATAGARMDYHTTNLSSSETSLNPKLALRYLVAPPVTLRASVGAGYRAPSAIEQFVSAVEFGYRVIPNPSLTGEHAVSGEIGVNAGLWGGARLDAAAFQSDYRDLIAPSAVPDSVFVFQFRNVQRARIRGVDAGLDVPLVADLVETHLTYLYLDPIDLNTRQYLPYRSRHNATATFDFLGGLAGVDVQYRSRVESVLVYPLDPRGDITIVDLRANAEVRGAVLQAKVSNLFNRVYPDVQERVPGQPRTFSLAILRKF